MPVFATTDCRVKCLQCNRNGATVEWLIAPPRAEQFSELFDMDSVERQRFVRRRCCRDKNWILKIFFLREKYVFIWWERTGDIHLPNRMRVLFALVLWLWLRRRCVSVVVCTIVASFYLNLHDKLSRHPSNYLLLTIKINRRTQTHNRTHTCSHATRTTTTINSHSTYVACVARLCVQNAMHKVLETVYGCMYQTTVDGRSRL